MCKQRFGECPRHVVKGILWQTKSAHHRRSPTSAMATYSSSTADISAKSAGASDHNLDSFSTKAPLAGASAARKLRLGLRCALRALPLPVMKIPRRLETATPALRGVGADATAASRPPSIRGRLREAKWGRFKGSTIGFLLHGARDGAYRKGYRTVRKDKRRRGKPSWPAPPRACAIPPPGPSRPLQLLARPWHPHAPKAIISPSLALHKTKESQVKINKKTYIRGKRSVPLEKSLRINMPVAAKKKSLARYFSLGSQFMGSLSLDFVCFRLGPFWASTTYRPRTVILLDIEVEVASRPFFNLGRLPIGVSDRLPLVPIGKVSPTRFAVYEEKVIFPVFNLGLFLDSRRETFLVIKAIPPKSLVSLGVL
ncbi:LOW QUALITY PROTEIN: hypothetical protein Cgig2_000431 [Carnegiea gigantea]|uniref:Uncharacterized protein n=1 Tax=Carnegiea gigantea TaxID=171969 RepID=A0A9Q1JPF0_9CARY|nr:LOW QUALITY PROTEIN: hypothetical protein Cgig2_000431 [Carnegiea gigantea]